MSHVAFGYDTHGEEIEDELDALFQAIEYVLDESMSLREAADYISFKTKRSISHAGFNAGFKKRMEKELEKANGREEQESITEGSSIS